jgi:hypothetical protein
VFSKNEIFPVRGLFFGCEGSFLLLLLQKKSAEIIRLLRVELSRVREKLAESQDGHVA